LVHRDTRGNDDRIQLEHYLLTGKTEYEDSWHRYIASKLGERGYRCSTPCIGV
jgi:hypothetical protein